MLLQDRPFSHFLSQSKTQCEHSVNSRNGEQVKVSKCRKFWELELKTVALVKFLKTENLTMNKITGIGILPFQPQSHANCHTLSFIIWEYCFVFKNLASVSFQY